MRETTAEKADRLLAEGKVRILRVSPEWTVARVEGDHHVYAVTATAEVPLHCECLAAEHHMRCSHLIAVERVLITPSPVLPARPPVPTTEARGDRPAT